MFKSSIAPWCAVAIAASIIQSTPSASASAFSAYGSSYREFSAPPIGSGSFDVVGDVLPDGRLVAVTGNEIFVESSPQSGVFELSGSLDAATIGGATDPSFLRVSPDGSRFAIGAGFGKPVVVLDSVDLSAVSPPSFDATNASVFDVGHFDAAWQDNARLAITAGDFGSPAIVSLLDTTSDPLSPMNPIIISNIGGASAGIAFDGAGRLFTGNGFDSFAGGSETGTIRAFDPADWAMTPANFEVDGAEIGELLSATSLSFDHKGNLFVGGGDFGDGDSGALGVIEAGAVEDAIAGLGAIDPLDPLQVRRLDPRGDGFGYFGSAFNGGTGELIIRDGATWYATAPAPGAFGVLALGVWGSLGRRRHVA